MQLILYANKFHLNFTNFANCTASHRDVFRSWKFENTDLTPQISKLSQLIILIFHRR